MDGLSAETTKKGRLQRACLDLLHEHEADGALPSSIRFLFYELLDRGVVPKAYRGPDGVEKKRTPGQDISDAVNVLREAGLVPWSWIVDETRTLDNWRYARSVYQYVEDTLPLARIDLWDGEPPPLILCESRSLAGAPWRGLCERLRRTTSAHSPPRTARREVSSTPRSRRWSRITVVLGACSTWVIWTSQGDT